MIATEVYKFGTSGAPEDQQTLPPSGLIPILFGEMQIFVEPAAGVEPATF
jgi:hypothetical protein